MHGSMWRREETKPVGPARAARLRRLPPTRPLPRPVESAQYTAGDYAQEVDDANVLASIGSVGDAYDKALVS
jgi:hypothetical protein